MSQRASAGEPEKYDGKTVRFLAQVYRGKDVPAGSFVPGRFGMVCCADDVTFLGFICRYDRAEELGVRDWVTVTASVTVETLPQYRGEGPVLHAIEVVPAEKAKVSPYKIAILSECKHSQKAILHGSE